VKFWKWYTVDGIIVWTTFLALIAEVALSYVTSYQHIYELDLRVRQHGTDARTTPIVIDLAILVFALVNLFAARKGRSIRWLKLTLWAAVLGTVAANAAYGMWGGYTGAAVAGGTAILLALTVEAGMTMLRVAAEAEERERKEADAEEAREEAERAAALERNRQRGIKAAQTRQARRIDPGTVQDDALDGLPEDPFPTQEVPVLTGIGLNGAR
jgi:hypothetical protein